MEPSRPRPAPNAQVDLEQIPSITFRGLRHSFVAILVAAGRNVREVSLKGWA